MAFKIFVSILLIFVIGNFFYFFKSQSNYSLHLRTLRKGLYTLFIVAIGIGILIDEFDLANGQLILTLIATVVFIDITILLTPSILKIFNTEFQYMDYVESIITTNDKRGKATIDRVNSLSELIQLAGENFKEQQNEVYSSEIEELESYLKRYSDQYGFSVQIYELNFTPIPLSELSYTDKRELDEEELKELSEQLGFVKGIETCLNKIEKLNSYNLGENRQMYIEELSNLKIVSLLKDDSMIVPVDMEKRQFLIVLKNNIGELLEVDAVHIINLIYIFYIYKEDVINKRTIFAN